MSITNLFYKLIIVLVVFYNIAICAESASDIKQDVYYKQFQEVFERVGRDYVQDPDKQKMTDSAINGMLTSLDPYSGYYTDEDLDDFLNHTKGEFGGIGVEVMYDNNAIKVIAPIDGLPAAKAGIISGDYIVGVNEELVSTLGFNKAVKEMRGEPGSKVKLLIIKENEVKPQEIELVRKIVKIKAVKSQLEGDGIAYIKIVSFNENTISELKQAVKKLQNKQKIKGIILDLRNNPGGLLPQAFAVGEYFIDSGLIVSTKGRSESNNTILTASKFAAKAPDVPMVVLINSGSASASEIVAGALQDYKRAIILGTRSFGKGSVQTFFQVSSRAAVKLTTAKYYTPNGRSIQSEGIEPDIVVEQAKIDYSKGENEEQKSLEKKLKKYLKNQSLKLNDKNNDNNNNDDSKKEQEIINKETINDNKLNKNSTKTIKNESVKDDNKKDIIEADNSKKTEGNNSDLYKQDYQFARAYDLIRGLVIMNETASRVNK